MSTTKSTANKEQGSKVAKKEETKNSPKYVKAVAMFCNGKTYKEIAKELSTTENYVSGNVNDAATGLKQNSPGAHQYAGAIKVERARRETEKIALQKQEDAKAKKPEVKKQTKKAKPAMAVAK